MANCFALVAVSGISTLWLTAKGAEAGDGSCVWPRKTCDEEKCVETWQTCDGTEDCEDGADENRGHCNKHEVCHSRCVPNSGVGFDRWAVAACIGCCLQDWDSDGFITEQDLHARWQEGCEQTQCDSDSLVNYWTANNVPMCEEEMTAYAKFMCGLADDVSTLSADDVTALWELEGGDSKTSGLPISRCLNFWRDTVKAKFQEDDCDLGV